ncbi:hypothetical protein V1511DRAFT_486212 [Dipodascopsis uninucleata]
MKSFSAIALGISTFVAAASAYTVHNVTVGNNTLFFEPNSITAEKGDYVRFIIMSTTHGIAQTLYSTPCQPLESEDAFYSGLLTVAGSDPSDYLEFTIQVNSTDPIWYYCPEAYHCQSGTVGVINPPKNSTESITSFTDAASRASSNVVPSVVQGNVTIGDSSSSSSSIVSSSTSTFATSSATSIASTTSASASSTETSSAAITLQPVFPAALTALLGTVAFLF